MDGDGTHNAAFPRFNPRRIIQIRCHTNRDLMKEFCTIFNDLRIRKISNCTRRCRWRYICTALRRGNLRIESIRLKGYNYSTPGGYFITINVQDRECVFGEISDGKVQLFPAGEIARRCWAEIPDHFPTVELDVFIVMPNHVHGIITIVEPENTPGRVVACNVSTISNAGKSPYRGSLAVIIRSYKSAVTKLCRENGYRDFSWQSRFYDRIIRDERELQNIRDYIINNPIAQSGDHKYPAL